ncbi:THO complex subunit 4A [Linum grandiflorum]
MSTALDMSLEDIIKANKKSKSSSASSSSRGGKPPRSAGPGPSRRGPSNRAANRSAPYSKPPQAPESSWQHDKFTDVSGAVASGRGSRAASLETGTKIYISNLDYGVSEDDIKELFSEVGDMKRYTVHYDRSGRSEGTAEIVFARREDAIAAVKRYNNVQLDGKPMKIEMVAKNVAAAVPPPSTDGFNRNQNGGGRRQGRGRSTGGSRGGGGGGNGGGGGGGRGGRGGKGRGRGRAEKEKVSAEDLDADLEKYHSGAMQED